MPLDFTNPAVQETAQLLVTPGAKGAIDKLLDRTLECLEEQTFKTLMADPIFLGALGCLAVAAPWEMTDEAGGAVKAIIALVIAGLED